MAKAKLAETSGEAAAALQMEVEDYEAICAGRVTAFEAGSIGELGELLIMTRLGRGWSPQQLASVIGVTGEQIERDELDGNQSVSLARAHAIAEALELDISTWAFSGDLADGPV